MRLASLALLLFASPALADPPAVVLKAARMFDGKSDQLSSPGVVVVARGKIVSAGPRSQIPPGAQLIDLGDATLLPGFFDAHTHLSSEASEDWKVDPVDGLADKVMTGGRLNADAAVKLALSKQKR